MSEPVSSVADDVENHRFLHREGGADAHLVYRVHGDRLILAHTDVPEALGGRGIGGRLVPAVVERAEASGETCCRGARTPARRSATTPTSPAQSPSTGAIRRG